MSGTAPSLSRRMLRRGLLAFLATRAGTETVRNVLVETLKRSDGVDRIRRFVRDQGLAANPAVSGGLRQVLDEFDTAIRIQGIVFDGRERTTATRGERLYEPGHVLQRWIEAFFRPGQTFCDVGANIGRYALYATVKKGVGVLAFEPNAHVFGILVGNILLNGCADRIIPLNVALHDSTTIAPLHVPDGSSMAAGSQFGPSVVASAPSAGPSLTRSCLGYRLDDLIEQFGLPVPDHVKIDVDGNEDRVLRGMQRTLSNPKVKSIAVESVPDAARADLEGKGFRRRLFSPADETAIDSVFARGDP